jgi:hypothetical protein
MKYIYYRWISAGRITIDDVPEHWKKEVQDLISLDSNS